jgi:hypothetical protein
MSTSMPRLPFALLLAAVLGVALPGCAGQADYPAFDREQTADDLLPQDFPIETDEFDLSTTRYVGSHEDIDYFLIKAEDGADAGGPCLVVIAPAGPVIGCGGTPLTVGSAGNEASLAPAGTPAGESTGWTRLSENVVVRDAR